MPDVEPLLLKYCLRAYGALNETETPKGGQQRGESAAAALFSPASHPQASFALDVAKIARFKVRPSTSRSRPPPTPNPQTHPHQHLQQAHQIFRQGIASGRPQGPVWERGAFLLEWEASLPSTHRPDPAWLRGVALEESVGGEERLRYLPAEAMPLDPAERVKRLFEARRRWAFEEVAPYLRYVPFPPRGGLGCVVGCVYICIYVHHIRTPWGLYLGVCRRRSLLADLSYIITYTPQTGSCWRMTRPWATF